LAAAGVGGAGGSAAKAESWAPATASASPNKGDKQFLKYFIMDCKLLECFRRARNLPTPIKKTWPVPEGNELRFGKERGFLTPDFAPCQRAS
jgi:hypothetical protein